MHDRSLIFLYLNLSVSRLVLEKSVFANVVFERKTPGGLATKVLLLRTTSSKRISNIKTTRSGHPLGLPRLLDQRKAVRGDSGQTT